MGNKVYILTVIWKSTVTKVERQLFHEKHGVIKVKMINENVDEVTISSLKKETISEYTTSPLTFLVLEKEL